MDGTAGIHSAQYRAVRKAKVTADGQLSVKRKVRILLCPVLHRELQVELPVFVHELRVFDIPAQGRLLEGLVIPCGQFDTPTTKVVGFLLHRPLRPCQNRGV